MASATLWGWCFFDDFFTLIHGLVLNLIGEDFKETLNQNQSAPSLKAAVTGKSQPEDFVGNARIF
jgi:hypothetical protein